MFTSSHQDLKRCSPGRQQGLKLVMYMAVAIQGILRDFWQWHRQRDMQREGLAEQNKYKFAVKDVFLDREIIIRV